MSPTSDRTPAAERSPLYPLYTTTAQWEPGLPLPLGMSPVTDAAACKMNHKPLVLDARRIAFIPATDDFFPRLHAPAGAAAYQATKAFRRRVESTLAELARRPDLLHLLDPLAPRRHR